MINRAAMELQEHLDVAMSRAAPRSHPRRIVGSVCTCSLQVDKLNKHKLESAGEEDRLFETLRTRDRVRGLRPAEPSRGPAGEPCAGPCEAKGPGTF
jgi:hypothetical protein